MNAADLELIRKIIEDAVRASSDGIDTSIVGAVVSVLLSAIAGLWGWGFKLSKDFASKIEEILGNQQQREDQKEQAQETKLTAILETKEARHQQELERLNTRIDRLEQARDFATKQYNNSLKDAASLLARQLSESTASLQEHCEMTELVIPLLKRISKEG